MTIITPANLPKPRGFSHGVLAPPGAQALFVAGQNASNEQGRVDNLDFVAQFDLSLARVLDVVRSAGGDSEHVVRLTVYVTDLDAYRASRPQLRDVWRRHMGQYYPAMTLVEVTRLVDEQATVEIEATAVVPVKETAE